MSIDNIARFANLKHCKFSAVAFSCFNLHVLIHCLVTHTNIAKFARFCLQIFRNCSVMYRSWLSLNLLLGLLGCFQDVVRVGWERGCRLFLSCSILPAPTLVLYSPMIWKGSMTWVDERAVLTVTLVCCYRQSSMCVAGIHFCVFVHYFSVPRTSVSVQLHLYFLIQIKRTHFHYM